MNSNHELDRMLDQALSEYRDAEPLAGMEDRILRRIAGQPEPVSRRRVWILAAAAAVAMIVIASWLGLREHPHRQPVVTSLAQPAQQATITPHIETPLASPNQRAPHTLDRESEIRRAGAQRQLPRHDAQAEQPMRSKPQLAEFPTPAPMTAEEHALLALARAHPDALLARADDTDELSITPIEIKPLAPEAGATQGEQQ
jgi:hypothetical protein